MQKIICDMWVTIEQDLNSYWHLAMRPLWLSQWILKKLRFFWIYYAYSFSVLWRRWHFKCGCTLKTWRFFVRNTCTFCLEWSQWTRGYSWGTCWVVFSKYFGSCCWLNWIPETLFSPNSYWSITSYSHWLNHFGILGKFLRLKIWWDSRLKPSCRILS